MSAELQTELINPSADIAKPIIITKSIKSLTDNTNGSTKTAVE